MTFLGTVLSIVFLIPPMLETQYRCWDQSLGSSRRECTAPSGAAGLLWFFPSLERAKETCQYAPPVRVGKLATYVCPFTLGASEGYVRYSAWPDAASARTYYEDQFHARGRIQHVAGEGVGYQWVTRYSTVKRYPYKRAGSFYTARFSWTVYASTLRGLDFGTCSVDVRDPEHWKYVRTETPLRRLLGRLTP